MLSAWRVSYVTGKGSRLCSFCRETPSHDILQACGVPQLLWEDPGWDWPSLHVPGDATSWTPALVPKLHSDPCVCEMISPLKVSRYRDSRGSWKRKSVRCHFTLDLFLTPLGSLKSNDDEGPGVHLPNQLTLQRKLAGLKLHRELRNLRHSNMQSRLHGRNLSLTFPELSG